MEDPLEEDPDDRRGPAARLPRGPQRARHADADGVARRHGDGRRAARSRRSPAPRALSAFDVAKTLYGLVTSDLVEIRSKADARGPRRPRLAGRRPRRPPAAAGPVVTTHSGVFNAVTRGDERRSLQILCTKVKQEAESAALAPGDPAIDRLYRAALGEVDKGRGLDVVRELIRSLEQTVAALRGREASLAFREKMAPLL